MKASLSRLRTSPVVALLAFLGLLALLLVGGITWFVHIYKGQPKDGTLDFEIAKTLLEIGVVSVAAAVVSLMAKYYERSVEKQQKDRDSRKTEQRYREGLLQSTVNRITASYNDIKRARRTMRARGVNRSGTAEMLLLKQYDECLGEVNDAQLEFETIIRDVETLKGAFPSACRLNIALLSMEKYLGELLGEYEQHRPPSTEKTEIKFDRMDFIQDFIGRAKHSKKGFKRDFAKGHSVARRLINKDLLTLTSK